MNNVVAKISSSVSELADSLGFRVDIVQDEDALEPILYAYSSIELVLNENKWFDSINDGDHKFYDDAFFCGDVERDSKRYFAETGQNSQLFFVFPIYVQQIASGEQVSTAKLKLSTHDTPAHGGTSQYIGFSVVAKKGLVGACERDRAQIDVNNLLDDMRDYEAGRVYEILIKHSRSDNIYVRLGSVYQREIDPLTYAFLHTCKA